MKSVNSNDKAPKVVEFHNSVIPVDEDTRFSINYFPPRPHYRTLLNNISLPNNGLFRMMLETILLGENNKTQSNIFPQGGLDKCRRLITLVDKGEKINIIPKVCLLMTSEDPSIMDNLLQIYLKTLQKVDFPHVRLLYMEAFEIDSRKETNNSNIKAIRALVKAAKLEGESLVIIFFGGMNSLQLNKKDLDFINYCSEGFQDLKRVLLMIPVYIDKDKGSRKFHANQFQFNYHESIEISVNVNTKMLTKRLKNIEFMNQYM